MVVIRIDTSKDSKSDITRVIELLRKYAEAEQANNDVPDAPPGVFDMFNNPPQEDRDEHDGEKEPEDKEDDEDLRIKPIFY